MEDNKENTTEVEFVYKEGISETELSGEDDFRDGIHLMLCTVARMEELPRAQWPDYMHEVDGEIECLVDRLQKIEE